jgi:hypothetical protein
MVMVVVGAGIPGGMVLRFHHGDRQPKKKRLGFLKKRPIFFEKS